MKYTFTKTPFRLQFPGLAGKICIANFKRNKLHFCGACYLATKRKTFKRGLESRIFIIYPWWHSSFNFENVCLRRRSIVFTDRIAADYSNVSIRTRFAQITLRTAGLKISVDHGHCPTHSWNCPTWRGNCRTFCPTQVELRLIVCPTRVYSCPAEVPNCNFLRSKRSTIPLLSREKYCPCIHS